LVCFAVLSAQAQEPRGQDATVRGRAIALSVCSACHVVAADQPHAPTLRRPGPSFQTIANRPTTTVDTLRRFISTTHTTAGEPFRMPNPELTEEMQAQVVSYVLSLRKRP
jgi:mono/diheme cytochrome c family protein